MATKLDKPQARSLVAIDRELDLAAINAKKNKEILCPSRQVDPKPCKALHRRVEIVEKCGLGPTSSFPDPQSVSISRNNTNCHLNTGTNAFHPPSATAETNSDGIGSVGTKIEQQAAKFMDGLFGVWTENIKAFDEFKLSKVLNGRNSSPSL